MRAWACGREGESESERERRARERDSVYVFVCEGASMRHTFPIVVHIISLRLATYRLSE